MGTRWSRKLFLAGLILGGLTLVWLAILFIPAASVTADSQGSSGLLEAHDSLAQQAVQNPALTHPYTPTLTFISAAGGEGYSMLADGGYAYVGVGTQLTVYDVSDPSAPRQVKRLGQRGEILQMQLLDSRLFVAASYGGLRIYDMTNPQQPRLLGSYAEGHSLAPFLAAGSLVYAIEWPEFQVIDISNPASPSLRGIIDDVYGYSGHIFTVGSTVFAGSQTIDASDPDQPVVSKTITGTWTLVEGGLAIADTVDCFKGTCWGGMIFYDISNPSNLQLAGEYETDSELGNVQLEGDILFFSRFDHIEILDISQPQNPVLLGTVPGGVYEVDGGWLYARSWEFIDPDWVSGVEVWELSDLAQPRLRGKYTTLNYVYNYARSGNTIFLQTVTNYRDFHELQLVDISHRSNPRLVGRSYEKELLSISEALVEGERAYALASTPFFHVLDFRNAAAPNILGSHPVTDLWLNDLSQADEFAYVNGGGQLKVLDIHDPSQPTIIQTYGGSGNEYPWIYQSQILDNHLGYVVVDDWENNRANLRIVQFNPPAQPLLLAMVLAEPNHHYGALDGTQERLFITRDNGIVELLDTHDPSSPTLTGFYSGTQRVGVLRQAGDLVLLGGDGKLGIVDFSQPTSPTLAGELEIPTEIFDIQVDGSWAYVAAGSSWETPAGMWVVDISDPTNPTLLDIYPTQAYHIQIKGGLAYISAGRDGLQVVSLFEPSLYLPLVLGGGP